MVRPAVAAIVLAGCSVGDIDYTGKACPCPDGWSCVSRACTRAHGGVLPDGAASGARIVASNLRGAWSTPNTIAWQWDVVGTKDDFGAYELTIAHADDAGAGKTWTAADSAELGRFILPNPDGHEDVVTSTMTDGLTADTTYTAKLVAIDSGGKRSTSNEARLATTIALARKLVMFDDTMPAGFPLPAMLAITPGCGVGGSACLRYVPASDPECTSQPATSCYQNLRWQGLGLDTSAFTQGILDQTAYYEFHVASTAPVEAVGYWSDMWLKFNDTNAAPFAFHPWTYRPSTSYRTLQVPLRALMSDVKSLDLATLQSGILEFNVGSTWAKMGEVYLDDVAIFY